MRFFCREKDLITIRKMIYSWFSSQHWDFYECQSGRKIVDTSGTSDVVNSCSIPNSPPPPSLHNPQPYLLQILKPRKHFEFEFKESLLFVRQATNVSVKGGKATKGEEEEKPRDIFSTSKLKCFGKIINFQWKRDAYHRLY